MEHWPGGALFCISHQQEGRPPFTTCPDVHLSAHLRPPGSEGKADAPLYSSHACVPLRLHGLVSSPFNLVDFLRVSHVPDAGLDASVCTLVEALCGLYHAPIGCRRWGGRAQVRDRGRLQARRELGAHQNSAAGSNTGGCVSQSRLGPQSSEFQSSWEAPRDLWCQDMSGSTGGADHTVQTRVSETWATPRPLFLTILLQN